MLKKTIQLLITIACIAAATGEVSAKVAAKFEAITGLVQYREQNGKWQNAKIGTPLTPNTELQTGPTGHASLIFPNGTKVTLKSGTLVKLDQYTTGSYGTQTNMSLRVGRMQADIAKVNDANVRNHFRVRTPTVVAGVRGSSAGFSNGTSTTIEMKEHSIQVRDNNGQSTTVSQGDKTQVTKSGTITADKMASKENTTTLAGRQGTTGGEIEMSFSSGDISFSGNFGDLFDLFELFDEFEALEFASKVTFEKL